ncbi:cyclin-A2 [Leptinotarsa decemlineata]|uniref:cyclin-A2 n=1 Tax=Leptinotarsa decemlineata TaxID=7539 RepID=UPI003D30B525
MATFQIHQDNEENLHHVATKKFSTTAANVGIKHGQKKKFMDNREKLQVLENGVRINAKKAKLTETKNEIENHNQKDSKQLVETTFLKIEKENRVASSKKERDYFPRSLSQCDEYKQEIWQYLRHLEERGPNPNPSYMDKQSDINWNSRTILVDWLAGVSEEYKFCDETFHLCVNYIDRFLSQISVARNKFQLVGAAAMMLATKMEEYHPVDSKEWSYLTGDTFSSKQVLKMEQLILKVLKFRMQLPTIHGFIQHLSTEHKMDEKTIHLAMYISELVLLEGEEYLNHYPSKLASACIALARHILSKSTLWPKKLKKISGYTMKDLSPVVQRQIKTLKDSPMKEQQSIQSKYKSPKYNRVALMKPKVLLIEDSENEEE